jgi:putative membrane-bound dehydrogenase-like protein
MLLAHSLFCCLLLWTVVGWPAQLAAAVDIPKAVDARLIVELFAAEPEIVTPTGIAVDSQGRVLAIESHTHFRPPNYQGPPADRIRMFADTDGDGRADQITTFFEGTRWTMNLAIDRRGSVYVATRNEIFRLRDNDGDGVADERTPIVRMESEGNYPHNGLSGFAFDQADNVYFGMGENLGVPYKLIGSDGSSQAGAEGGHIFRCTADGSRLERFATGFWNPFHLAFDREGRLFAVDNDPDSLPPCRLLHVVAGGNYGYKFRNGRRGLHPFTAWNGELPGTLPMVAGTGEAPSGVVAYEANHLPADYRGELLVTSWGDHRLERFRLEPRGASFRSQAKEFVSGGENFRPVGIAIAPDGSLFVSDWADKSYEVHGKGRLWHIRSREKQAAAAPAVQRPPRAAAELRAEALRSVPAAADSAASPERLEEVWKATEDVDPFVQQAARGALARSKTIDAAFDSRQLNPARRLAALLVLRESEQRPGDFLNRALSDSDPLIRFVALQWVGEERLEALRPALDQALAAGPVSGQLFAAYLATLEKLAGGKRNPNDEWAGEQYVAQALGNPQSPAEVRRWALRSLRTDHPLLTIDFLSGLIAGNDPLLEVEAVRTLRTSALTGRAAKLLAIASDPTGAANLRAEALVGLSPADAPVTFFVDLAENQVPAIRREALRSLVGKAVDSADAERLKPIAGKYPDSGELVARLLEPNAPLQRPSADDTDGWLKLLETPAGSGVPADKDGLAARDEGERIFFNSRAGGCYRCHTIDARGGRIGPDLSVTARTLDRRRLVESILRPGKEVAPQFAALRIETTGGRVLIGMPLSEAVDGTQTYADEQGGRFEIRPGEVESRVALPRSLMPDGLERLLTVDEFRSLLAFLAARQPGD